MPARARPEQDAAKYVVESIDGTRLNPADVDGVPPGTHDFDVEREAEIVGAVEVTMLIHAPRQRLDAAVGKWGTFDAPALRKDWHVALSRDAIVEDPVVKTATTWLVPLLLGFEERGLDSVGRDQSRSFGDLPLSSAFAHDPARSVPRVTLMAPSAGGMVWAGTTHAAIESALAGGRFEGERDKLARSARVERHLFVWVTQTVFDAFIGIASEEAPADAIPNLPSEVTTLWLGATAVPGYVVWRSSGGLWERLVVPYRPEDR
jgi:hypothetical protein